MRKCWIVTRQKPQRGNYYFVRWYDGSKNQRGKSCPNLTIAREFARRKEMELNTDLWPEINSIVWDMAVEAFMEHQKAKGTTESTRGLNFIALRHFHDICPLHETNHITQDHIERYINNRLDSGKSKYTVNRELSSLRTFFNWLKEKRYHVGLQIHRLRCPTIIFRVPPTNSIQNLFRACPSLAWRIRLLISLCTGLRAGDVDRLAVSDIDLNRKSITIQSQKTGKTFPDRPLPDAAMPEIERYIKSLDQAKTQELTQKSRENSAAPIFTQKSRNDRTTELFRDKNRRKTWESIRLKAGMPDLTRQHLRKTFSTLMQTLGSIGSAQTLLEHTDSRTTKEFYSDTDLILRWKVNQLPINSWLK